MNMTIFYLFIYCMEGFIFFLYADRIFTVGKSRHACLLGTCVLYGLLFLFSFSDLVWLKTFSFFFANFLCLFLLFRVKWYSALFHTAFLTAVMGSSEVIVMGLNTRLYAAFQTAKTYTPDTVFLILSSKLLYLLITQLAIFFFHKTKDQDRRPDPDELILNMIPLLSITVYLTLGIISGFYTFPSLLQGMITISGIFLLLINFLIFWVYQRSKKKNEEYTAMQLQIQQEKDQTEYYQMLARHDESQKILIHDIKHHLQAIDDLSDSQSCEKIHTYVQNLLRTSYQDQVKVSDNHFLNLILSRYIQLCRDQNIAFETDIRAGLLGFLDYQDMTALFTNLLDNAVASASEMESTSFIDLRIRHLPESSCTLISLINSCPSSPYDALTGTLSTKKKNKMRHGYGMRSVSRVVKAHQGNMDLYYDDESKTFHTTVQFPDE